MKRLAAALLLGSVLASPAWAVQETSAGKFDARVRWVAYNPMNVTRVVASVSISTEIMFATTEVITQVAIGDRASWVVPEPTGNIMFIMPATAGHPSTNMTVLTQRQNGERRSYQFDLTARGAPSASGDKVADMGGTIPEPAAVTPFAIQFVYPEDARQEKIAKWKADHAQQQEHLAENRLAVDYFYGPRNWRYVARGSTVIEPAETSDNGRLTAMRFPGNSPLPTIYTLSTDNGKRRVCGRDADKQAEAVVQYTMRADVAVIATTASDFCLRSGSEVLQISNLAYEPVGYNPQTGTTSPEIVRSVRAPQ